MKMKTLYIIHSTLYIALALALSANAEEIRVAEGFSWNAIDDPGVIAYVEPTFTDPPGFVHEEADTPLAPLGSESDHSLMNDIRRADIRARARAETAGKFPPVLYLTISVPHDARGADKVFIEAELPYGEDVDITKCVQLIPLTRAASTPGPSADVQEATSELDYTHTVTATPNREGVFRFDITEVAGLIEDGTIGNRFVLKPFKARDSFDVRSVNARTFAFVIEDEE